MYYKRAGFHDYKRPGMYMITMTLLPGVASMCRIGGSPSDPSVLLTAFGRLVEAHLREIHSRVSPIYVNKIAIMPDHVHLQLTVTKYLTRPIGKELAVAKSQCSKDYAELMSLAQVSPVFGANFHDRIIFDAEQLTNCNKYIDDNPRRLLVKREHPDLFRRYLHLDIAGIGMAAYGNIFLLRDFQKMAVMIHRASTDAEKAADRERWLDCACNGGVLVSPFFSPEEKAVCAEAIGMGGRIIQLQLDGMPERFKPVGHEFELCQEGRLLILAPWPDGTNSTLTREKALTLNHYASRIASIGTPDPLLLKGGKGG